MESLLTLFFIFVLCIFVYAYINMSYKYRSYSQKCNILYIPENDEDKRIKSPYTEIIDHTSHDNDGIDTVFPPQVSEIESLYPPVNSIRDRNIFVELVP